MPISGGGRYEGSRPGSSICASDPVLGHVEEAAQGFSDDLTRCCVIGLGTGFYGCAQLRIDSDGDHIGRS